MIDNPYWDAVKDHIDPTGSLWGTPEVGSPLGRPDIKQWLAEVPQRHDMVSRYSWTITDPDTAAFVAEHSGGRLVDPMAGTAYWGWVLAQHGVDVVSSDAEPGTNHYHQDRPCFGSVAAMPGIEAAALHADRTLFLAWPPYNTPDGADILAAYRGDRVIYVGEGDGGCCGDDRLHELLAKGWREVAHRVPVQWFGIHDVVTVYDRAGS
ncbi:hypothetical protein ABT369_39235 [Dactylosporangium sp. NPDC000244]|uniref:hypothetical protein n=1 Tax=Dactylosporangium sp. NPDC000244 TaxID=3154365 RepID=UPI00332934C6